MKEIECLRMEIDEQQDLLVSVISVEAVEGMTKFVAGKSCGTK